MVVVVCDSNTCAGAYTNAYPDSDSGEGYSDTNANADSNPDAHVRGAAFRVA
jgi:hypothetical protein